MAEPPTWAWGLSLAPPSVETRSRERRGGALDHVLDDRLQVLEVDGLGERPHAGLVEVGLVVADRDDVGEENEAAQRAGLALAQLAAELEAVELGHANVADGRVVVAAVDLVERLPAVGGSVHVVACRREPGLEEAQHEGVVLDGEDPLDTHEAPSPRQSSLHQAVANI